MNNPTITRKGSNVHVDNCCRDFMFAVANPGLIEHTNTEKVKEIVSLAEDFKLAYDSFAFLIKHGQTLSFTQWAEEIKNRYNSEQAKAVANSLLTISKKCRA